MSFHQTKDGRWFVKHYENGKEKRSYKGRGLLAEKEAKEHNKMLMKEGKISRYVITKPRLESPLFGDLAESYMQAKALDLPETSTTNNYYKITKVILPTLGEVEAMRINRLTLNRYVLRRLKRTVGNTEKKIKKTTIHRELSDIQAILNWAVKNEMIPSNPVAGYKKPARDDEIIMPPTRKEIQSILAYAPDHLKRVIMISYFTGLRPGQAEMHRITWDDVDLNGNVILIRSAQKGGLRSRLIPLHPEFKKTLEKWEIIDQEKKIKHIITYHGRTINSVKKAFSSAKQKAGITRRIRLYDFRHAFATNLLAAAGDLKSVSQMLGHTRTDTTLKIYQHTNTELHQKTIEKLPGLDVDADH